MAMLVLANTCHGADEVAPNSSPLNYLLPLLGILLFLGLSWLVTRQIRTKSKQTQTQPKNNKWQLNSKAKLAYSKDERRSGTVKWFNPDKGYGFIQQDVGDDLFVHRSELQEQDIRTLNKGDRVDFTVAPGRKGPVAKAVRRLEEPAQNYRAG